MNDFLWIFANFWSFFNSDTCNSWECQRGVKQITNEIKYVLFKCMSRSSEHSFYVKIVFTRRTKKIKILLWEKKANFYGILLIILSDFLANNCSLISLAYNNKKLYRLNSNNVRLSRLAWLIRISSLYVRKSAWNNY